MEVTFPFPSAEGLLVGLGLFVMLTIVLQSVQPQFMITDSPFSNQLELERLIQSVTFADFRLLTSTMFNVLVFLPILIPLFCAFVVAGPLENGVSKNMLTYPIKRSDLLIIKGLQITLLTSLPITVGAIVGITLFNGLLLGLESILTIISLWVFCFTILSTSFLISLVTKSAARSAFGGVVLWAILFVVATLSKLPVIVRGISNPLHLTMSFILGSTFFGNSFVEPVFGDVLGSLLIHFILGVVAFLASIRIFKGIEL